MPSARYGPLPGAGRHAPARYGPAWPPPGTGRCGRPAARPAHGRTGLPAALRAYDAERRRSAQRVARGSRALHRFVTTRRPALRDALIGLLA
ncbi:hypothetical protein ACIPW5_08810 [Streptomyces sp. NPDC090077]|uniref:hypothetical protein n=1 Tax=Streptomyces sp. NPDC090077 TaxID=3365938 RepID=UPI00382F117E